MMPNASSPHAKSALRARARRALFFFARALLGALLWDVVLAHLGLGALARRTRTHRYRRLARRFRALATDLGGVWIKVGQFLSARVDVLPEEVTSELAGLQDEVPPEPLEAVRRVVEAELGEPLEAAFAWFDPTPLASASLGQVHRARLKTGEAVAVKVQRPGIEDLIRVDLAALRRVLGWLQRYRPITRRVDLEALFQEFSRTLWQEVDYLAEAENARRFAAMFADDPAVRIPAVYDQRTTRRVLTLEDVYFIKIIDFQAIDEAGVDRAEVADRLLRTYLEQIFIQGFFHADPHPGNLFVEPLGEGRWRLVFVDFGMVGRLTPQAKAGLRELAIAVATRDADRILAAYRQLGVLLPGADLERIRQAEQAMLDRFWGLNLAELRRAHPREMQRLAREFRDLLYEMPFQVPTDLILLGRCLALLSGLCTALYPEFNVFDRLVPFARRLLEAERGSPLDIFLDWLLEQGQALLTMPVRLEAALTKIERGELRVMARAAPDLEERIARLTQAVDRLVGAVFFGALLLVGALLYTSGQRLLGGVALALAALLLAREFLRS